MDELKPCPFCGSAARLVGTDAIQCTDEECAVCWNSVDGTTEEIVRLWNTRPRESALIEELETERLRLSACGIVAMANTPESAKKARDLKEEYRSASLGDVERAVDRGMALIEERDRLSGIVATQADGLEAARADNAILQAENARLRLLFIREGRSTEPTGG
ncbi:MAG: hypothetical protein ABFE13_11495 [Phycisphaerales bacterium]